MAKKNETFVQHITPMEEDFSRWYTDVVLRAELMDYSEVRGCMVIRPYGYGIWELIQKELDQRFRATGHKNAYFPMFIPESLLKKEAEHVEGFAPEVAWVTKGGNEELAEPLVVRPTSETIICSMYAKWIQSYRDLPMLLNQWCNVVRWEKSTRPFLRTSEFLWQEGHTVHATYEEAQEETLQMLGVYRDFAFNVLAIPVLTGRKSENEKFAGAEATYTMEAIMHDGKALQMGTSHNLGQHFAKVFDIQFLDRDGVQKYAWQTSWGVSTRMIGGLIMVHGDERGLRLPPKLAPIQAIVIPIAAHKPGVTECAAEMTRRLIAAGIRAESDDRDQSPGWKFNEWELRGVPLRVEIGPRDMAQDQLTLVRRDTHEKATIPMEGAEEAILKLLEDIHANMLRQAGERMQSQITSVQDYDALVEAVNKGGFAYAPWCREGDCEEKLKADTGITTRCMPFEGQEEAEGKVCAVCGRPAKAMTYFAKSY
ncbi:proline--tRNA ligase [Christensenella sp. MSJ-20]|uniref:proline--tRNA ligase n=1 Tax=Christensenella sp. MSJ-20 TaxID=2841518 RepID=UPI001C747A5D|nr:proline--tRNA ligase [Christensenella sp. MSJ-20]